MPHQSNDEIIQHMREKRREQIQAISQRVARKIVSLAKTKSSATVVAELIAGEFEESNR